MVLRKFSLFVCPDVHTINTHLSEVRTVLAEHRMTDGLTSFQKFGGFWGGRLDIGQHSLKVSFDISFFWNIVGLFCWALITNSKIWSTQDSNFAFQFVFETMSKHNLNVIDCEMCRLNADNCCTLVYFNHWSSICISPCNKLIPTTGFFQLLSIIS